MSNVSLIEQLSETAIVYREWRGRYTRKGCSIEDGLFYNDPETPESTQTAFRIVAGYWN